MVFVCYLLLKEANIHINLICFDRNFDHAHISVVTFVPRKLSKQPQFLPEKHSYLSEKFLISLYLLKNWLKHPVQLLWCDVCPPFSKKRPNFQNSQIGRENRTNKDNLNLLFLAKPLDKHGTTLVHITYPPLSIITKIIISRNVYDLQEEKFEVEA